MSKRKVKIVDLMPKEGIDLIASTGRSVIERVGIDVIKDIIASVLCGENIRNLTEDLTKRRITILNGALLTLFIKGCNNIDDFIKKYPELVVKQLKQKTSTEEKNLLFWLLGLTKKGVQNVLRSQESSLEEYAKKYKESIEKGIAECKKSYGDLQGTIKLDKLKANIDWITMLSLLSAVGTQTLAIRGAEKSMYGKLFEKLVLGAVLTLLGFRKIDLKTDKSCNKVFWLTSRGSKRESDATALFKPGKAVRFDIGFIGPGNTEISLDKVSRFERELEFGRQKHFMATFIIVDRIGKQSRIVNLAKKINGVIIQMSMAFWPQVLAKKLNDVLGLKHAIQKMPAKNIESYIKKRVSSMPIETFIE